MGGQKYTHTVTPSISKKDTHTQRDKICNYQTVLCENIDNKFKTN